MLLSLGCSGKTSTSWRNCHPCLQKVDWFSWRKGDKHAANESLAVVVKTEPNPTYQKLVVFPPGPVLEHLSTPRQILASDVAASSYRVSSSTALSSKVNCRDSRRSSSCRHEAWPQEELLRLSEKLVQVQRAVDEETLYEEAPTSDTRIAEEAKAV